NASRSKDVINLLGIQRPLVQTDFIQLSAEEIRRTRYLPEIKISRCAQQICSNSRSTLQHTVDVDFALPQCPIIRQRHMRPTPTGVVPNPWRFHVLPSSSASHIKPQRVSCVAQTITFHPNPVGPTQHASALEAVRVHPEFHRESARAGTHVVIRSREHPD